MDRPAPKFDRMLLLTATGRANRRCADAIELARKLLDDTDRKARLAAQRCKSCFYFRSMGSASCTSQPCACCAKPEGYGSTNTDVLCLACAKEHSLCKKCGGDLEMRELRRKWPV
jgi:hypothetical protein